MTTESRCQRDANLLSTAKNERETYVTKTQVLRLVSGIILAGSAFGIASEAARDSSEGTFRTIAFVAAGVMLIASLLLAGPVLKAIYKENWNK